VLAARIATAVVLIAGLLAALFLLPPGPVAALIGFVLALAGFEWGKLCRLGPSGAYAYAAALAAAYGACLAADVGLGAFAAAGAFWLLAVPLWLRSGVHSGHRLWLALAGFVVLIPAGLAVVSLRPAHVLLVLLLIWIADTAAYFVGRRVGRRKLAPSVSPGKTWEGAVAALLGVLAYAIISQGLVAALGARVAGLAWIPYLGAAALLWLVSILGDLFESATKRQASVKDSGRLLPGHGGVLDRIDSASSTLPLAALLWLTLLE
jgi:phosphatidate cytidylyltransferase